MTDTETRFASAIALIKKYEGCRLQAYRDVVGKWTVGWGSTLGVTQGTHITQAQADAMLLNDVFDLSAQISKATNEAMLNDNQISALIDFAYNLGFGALFHSTLLREITQGKPKEQVAAEFHRWIYAGGHVLEPLVWRRNDEAKLYLS